MLLIVSGASGVGKSTLCKQLLAEHDELTLSVSTTTRAPRGREKNGVHYHFVDVGTFERMRDERAFAEWAEVHGNYYGTSKLVIDEAIADGGSVLFDIDYQGAEQLLRVYPDAVAVMVLPPDMEILERRLRGRGTDAEEVIQRRMAKAREEMRHAPSFQHLVVNDDLDQAMATLRGIYLAGRSRTPAVWPEMKFRLDL